MESFDQLKEAKEYMEFYSRVSKLNTKSIMIKSILLFFLAMGKNNDRSRFVYHGRTRFKVIINTILNPLKTKFRQFYIDRNFTYKIDENEKFVYYPMQVEPESTLLIGTPFYTNQLETIFNIAKSLPVGYKLYVKDHPVMKVYNWRNISYYKQIMDLPNVVLLHHSVNSREIIKKCSLVILMAGTSGLEAAFYEKPTIVFGDVFYSSLPSVYRLKSFEELPSVIRTSLQKKVDSSDLERYVSLIDQNSFEFNFMVFSDKDHPFHGTFLPIVDVPIPKVKFFLEKHNSVFEKLALEFIKKIKQYKEYESRNMNLL